MVCHLYNNVYICSMMISLKHNIDKERLKVSVIVCFVLMIATQTFAQHVTLSNNLLYDAAMTPNLRVGVRMAPHWSVGLNGGYRPWPADDAKSRKWKHLLIAPDLRYWTDSVNVRHFFGVNLIYSHYNVADVTFPFGMWKDVRDERRQGDLGAVGLYYGYSWPLGRFWNIEAHIGAALAYTKYDRFECGHCGTTMGDASKFFVLPQAGLSIVYNIPGRPRKEVVPVVEPILPPEVPAAKIEQKPFVPVLQAVPDFTGRAGQLQKDNPVLAHISTYKPYDRTRILRKEKEALYVHFDLGKSLLRDDFRENKSTLERIVDITRQILADTTSSVKKIQIVGLASIEGSIAGNERLAQNRANALQRYLQQQVSVPDSMFDTVGGGEAWADFRDQLNDIVTGVEPVRDGFPVESLRQAIQVIDSESDHNQRERKLRQLNRGRTWQYIKKYIFSDQRNSGYIRIYYDYVPDRAAATINHASELLGQGQYAEALQLLNTVRTDRRAQNALGVALYQTGRHEEALDCFRRAAIQGNADAQENLRQLDTLKPQTQ